MPTVIFSAPSTSLPSVSACRARHALACAALSTPYQKPTEFLTLPERAALRVRSLAEGYDSADGALSDIAREGLDATSDLLATAA